MSRAMLKPIRVLRFSKGVSGLEKKKKKKKKKKVYYRVTCPSLWGASCLYAGSRKFDQLSARGSRLSIALLITALSTIM